MAEEAIAYEWKPVKGFALSGMLAIVAAAVSLLAGMTQSKEYAELEWPLDLGVVVLWVMYAVNIIGTIIFFALNFKKNGMLLMLGKEHNFSFL